ncbi:MAG TPA: MiaB/RimO family radical SAM methylthiotransferase [Phycisphaerae bacterium]|nr:MiaB/RimO family radical SAM methylthiotransferase [Phycisphaerae bacterium]HPU25831.1 MiaB/RimO family radical SAM methylthiotransferase [Phycisphaerae bacterium]
MKSVYLETFGCQMNVLDSELVLGQLSSMGYQPTDDVRTADLVLFNTCSVRQHAEDKVYSRLGEVAKLKKRRPDMVVGVIGCMAERDHDGIQTKAPHVDLLCGPGNLNEIPSLLAEVLEAREAAEASRAGGRLRGDGNAHRLAVALERDHSRRTPAAERTKLFDSIEALDLSRDVPPDGRVLQSYVRVQRGCDKFCTFCVVPFTRGPERSRPPEHIVQEIRKLADLGAKEITLLGQTVNSYKYRDESGKLVNFADLLELVHDVGGIERIRFVTSYPGDFTDDILQAMRDLPKVCEYLHIPAQSGSNEVLKRMKRQYTVEQYEELLARAREVVPGISLAGDFIVGFCGETEADHEQTLALVERTRYKNIYMFKYSERPGTVADRRLPDDVPEAVKQRRHTELAALQKRMCLAHHQAMVGREIEVLVEGYSKAAIKAQEAEQTRGHEVSWKRSDQLTGRSRGDEIVVFTGPETLIGQFVRIRVTSATALTLHGEVVTQADRRTSLNVL